MRLDAEQLTRILQQPGYAVADGSLWMTPAVPIVKRPAPAKRWATEWDFQAAVIAEARQRAILQPEYSLLVAIPNGQYRKGQRPEAGLTPGLPDLMLMVRRGESGALFIELKVGAGKPSAAQMEMHYRLRREGYRVVMIWDSVDEVMQAIETYLAEAG